MRALRSTCHRPAARRRQAVAVGVRAEMLAGLSVDEEAALQGLLQRLRGNLDLREGSAA